MVKFGTIQQKTWFLYVVTRSLIMPAQPLTSATTGFPSKSPHKLFIDGDWVDVASSETYSSYSPSDGTRLAKLALLLFSTTDHILN